MDIESQSPSEIDCQNVDQPDKSQKEKNYAEQKVSSSDVEIEQSSVASFSREGGEEVDDEEDDEFGDFEEATSPVETHQIQPDEGKYDSQSKSLTQRLHSSESIAHCAQHCLTIPRILDEEVLWTVQDQENFDFPASTSKIINLFPLMDDQHLCSSSGEEEECLDAYFSKAALLWNQISNIDEMQALQFKWASSKSYKNLLKSLQLDKGTRKKFPGDRERRRQFGNSEPSYSSNSSNNGKDLSHSNANNTEINSLMVPPADFDWRSSGLANPLTGKAVPTSAAPSFDCSFLLDGKNPGYNVPPSSEAILERELEAFGLVSSSTKTDGARIDGSRREDGAGRPNAAVVQTSST